MLFLLVIDRCFVLVGMEDLMCVFFAFLRSRILVEEEGEVFRKGIVLLGPEEMDGDYAGEDLRREVCTIFFFFLLHDKYISFF